jgi:hypothetical protein
MSTTICGNCRHYQRGNAWSGTCDVDSSATSPGAPCPISKFEPHASAPPELPYGQYPTALLPSNGGAINFGSEGTAAFTRAPSTKVEVLSVVGAWAMVRRAEPIQAKSMMSDHGAIARATKPFVVHTTELEYATGRG